MIAHQINITCRELIFIQEALKARVAWYDDEDLWDDNFKKKDMEKLLEVLVGEEE